MDTRISQKKVILDRRNLCRSCGDKIIDFLDFDFMPLAGAFLDYSQSIECLYPMHVSFCPACTLVQIPDIVPKEILFNQNYHYFSSVTATLGNHFREYSGFIENLLCHHQNPFVVEFGCNDGVLLSKLAERKIQCLGIDASENVAEAAKRKGLDVLHGFFNEDVAGKIVDEYRAADVITGSNVFAHNDDVEEILKGVKVLLDKNGYFIVEVHYLGDLIRNFQFDFFYHEHCNYYSLHALHYLLNKFELEIVAVYPLGLHGGSIRVISQHASRGKISQSVTDFLALEKNMRLNDVQTYLEFADRIAVVKKSIRSKLLSLKAKGKRICGYGASGRAVTLLNYFQIGREVLDFIVDASPARANHLMPGIHVPIVTEREFRTEKTDVCLITAWSYAKEIIEKENLYLKENNSFIIPLPELKIIDKPTQ